MSKLMPAILILVSIGVFFFFIDPQYKQVKELEREKTFNSQLIADAVRLENEFITLQQNYNNISQEQRDLLDKVLPETVDNVRLTRDIDLIARGYGITIRNISVAGGPLLEMETNTRNVQSNTGEPFGTISLSFSVTASYDVFKRFMTDLENSLRIVDITNFSVAVTEDPEFYNYSVTLNTYWLR